MNVKIQINVTIDDETVVFFEKSNYMDFSEMVEMLHEASMRAEEHIDNKRVEFNHENS